MASPLIPVSTLAVWAQEEIEDTNPFAVLILDMASALVREAGGHPEWTAETAPSQALLYTGTLAVRTYKNPPYGEVASGIGPITSRLVDLVASTMALTPEEVLALGKYAPGATTGSRGGLWILSFEDDAPARGDGTIYLPVDTGDPMPMGQSPEDNIVYGIDQE